MEIISRTEHPKSFQIILIFNALFFSGYYILKCPLVYILEYKGAAQLASYQIVSSASVIFALCSLAMGFLLKNFYAQKQALFLGVSLSSLSILLLSSGHNSNLMLLAVTCYILGGSLYFFSIALLVNKQFTEPSTRLRGNFHYQIWVNLGGLIGGILFYFEMTTDYLFYVAFAACVFSLIVFYWNYHAIYDGDETPQPFTKFYITLTSLALAIFILLKSSDVTMLMVVIGFVAAIIYVVLDARKNRNYSLLKYILLVMLYSVPYWMAYTLIYSEFFDFLSKDVHPILGVSGNVLLLINPIVNILFGSILVIAVFQKKLNTCRNLIAGVYLILAAFLVLVFGIYCSEKMLSPILPAIAVVLYSMAELLIQTTMNATVRDMLPKPELQTVAMGILRSSRAFAAAVVYGIMSYNTLHHIHAESATLEMRSALADYTIFSLILLCVCFLASRYTKKLLNV